MLGIGAVPPVFIALGVLAMPESPRWLVQTRPRQNLGFTRRIQITPLRNQIRGRNTRTLHRRCRFHLQTTPRRRRVARSTRPPHPRRPPHTNVRRGDPLLPAGQQHRFRRIVQSEDLCRSGIHITRNNGLAIGFTKTIFILVATFLLDKIGRRPLLLSSVAGMILSLTGLAIGLLIINGLDHRVVWAIALCITAVLSYVAFFSIGMGPITWVYSSEIFPLKLRAQGCSMGVAMNRVTSGVISMTFISLYKAISLGGAFFLYAGVAVAAAAWVFFYTLLPETQGRTLEEMET
ncbi:hypothetical protein RD792_003590 [Penstemon davidsonii]|uniref:Major facilitator superfamily (MFS) profile domain-containing protein n=1 Tax=Penstemon davidsonii TaxID=160366 RepID=A0ABR0DF37_9LAMI|nr:hypothetical protein RD792_003590 [Penstemon davidsonii]